MANGASALTGCVDDWQQILSKLGRHALLDGVLLNVKVGDEEGVKGAGEGQR